MTDDTLTAAQDTARRFGKGNASQDDLQAALDAHAAETKKAATKRSTAKAAATKDEGETA